eukprot:g2011.t1
MLSIRSVIQFTPLSPVNRLRQCSKHIPRSNKGELSWDPEGLLGRAETGHIARRQMQKMIETDKEFATKVEEAKTEMQKETLARREARIEPKDLEGFVEYFLNTDMKDMQYEVTKWRPRLTDEFFAILDKTIGDERFSAEPDEDKLAELDSLRAYLEEAIKVIDNAVSGSTTAVERFKKLMTAKDKKSMILEMVAANEIDQLLIDLIDHNIEQARESNEEQKAEFMQKLRNACKRYC